ncbi:MAG: hypothetical protein RLZZ292_420 [Bacteroidota bacterium]|jgi:AAA+ ATPase superfamily predicted ATPase
MATTAFIGREKEQAILQATLQTSGNADMVAVIGRRRVGKTSLIKTVFKDKIDFEITGIQNAPLTELLQHFATRINKTFYDGKAKLKPRNWLAAFQMLIDALEQKNKQERMVVFFDELPWFDSHKSGFIRALGFFWNSWAVDKDIVVLICGSAASWMIDKVVYDKGGLHNRITKRIDLQPFNLYETELYLKSHDIIFDRYQILQLYMAMGGIPHYLKDVKGELSAAENIDEMCFAPSGVLNDEFNMLYPALFDNAEIHLAIIRVLAQTWKGLSRKDIIDEIRLADGGGISKALDELMRSGFISHYYPFGKIKKEGVFRLTDEYSLFYLRFIEKRQGRGEQIWQVMSQTPTIRTWSGYAFESICFKHLPQIKKALGITGVYTEASSFIFRGNETEKGIQIDLLLDRNDRIINLLEIKFYNTAWVLDKDDAAKLREKTATFKTVTQTSKQVFLTLISTFGIKPNTHSVGLVNRSFDMNILFEPIS